jgi:hypothetical protein
MWMIERGGGARFTHQPLAAVGRVRIRALHHLERDLAMETRVFGQPHHPHAAGAKLAEDLVRAY